jgi:phosphoribosyl-ATP pyrophosphohydrolase/phosphoribosyl-AMP cyclohydrolase
MLSPDTIDWEKMNGLIPAIVQHAFDGRVLMQGYMNREALEATLETRTFTFWSRSRKALWTKGETSGNALELVSLFPDCDGDCLLVLARPAGPTCHRGTDTCFDADESVAPKLAFLARLEAIIAQREQDRPEGSYTTELFQSGVNRIAQKVGEEGVEVALAAVSESKENLLEEASDLVYHLLVLLRARTLTVEMLMETLKARHDS